ncbi:helix-turn-helix transcriptional regulator [uncultured Novosphingobium sp.]|uniref:helix-turn-helix transcriptional regulator n=1 Tax=uncultured Novosphingobium sp. TaxID=292277 RepID=UPI002587A777|nr:helix-turn-helix transcriptional regulator [uncultured Novosphingobium sp.]
MEEVVAILDDAPSKADAIAAVVNALGTDEFEGETLRMLHDLSGVDHFSIYRVRGGEPRFLGGASISGQHALKAPPAKNDWPARSYAELKCAQKATEESMHAILMHDELKQMEDPALDRALEHYKIADRVVVCGKKAEDFYAIAALRSNETGEFAGTQLKSLARTADVLIAVCAKHAAMHWDKDKAAAQFGSIEKIEKNLRESDWGLSERELQVSARILFGITAYGIALDLGLGEETVATYRKRLYARLRLGGRHELLQRYLKLL